MTTIDINTIVSNFLDTATDDELLAELNSPDVQELADVRDIVLPRPRCVVITHFEVEPETPTLLKIDFRRSSDLSWCRRHDCDLLSAA